MTKHVSCDLRCIGHREPCNAHHGISGGRWTRLHGHVVNREFCGGPFEPFETEAEAKPPCGCLRCTTPPFSHEGGCKHYTAEGLAGLKEAGGCPFCSEAGKVPE